MNNHCGIYRIKNIINKKCYIGSTSVNFTERWRKHIGHLNRNKHHSIAFQRAWNKYGSKNFIFEIIERCDKRHCIKREQYYLDELNPEYNICKVARRNSLGFRFSKEARKKMSKSRRGKNNNFYGKTHSDESKEKMSKINKIRNIWKGKNNPKYRKGYLVKGCKNPRFVGKYIFIHEKYGKVVMAQYELRKKYKLLRSGVSMLCNGTIKMHRGWCCLKKLKKERK